MSGDLAAQSRWKRMEVHLHLRLCKYCSRLAGQIEMMRTVARRFYSSGSGEASGLEDRLVNKLNRN